LTHYKYIHVPVATDVCHQTDIFPLIYFMAVKLTR